MDVTDRNLGTGENRDRNQMVEDGQDQIMAGGQNQKRGQSRDVAAVIGAMKKNGEKEDTGIFPVMRTPSGLLSSSRIRFHCRSSTAGE